MIAASAIVLGVRVVGADTRTGTSRPGVFFALWPEQRYEDARRAVAGVDEGGDGWRRDEAKVARRFARQVLGWTSRIVTDRCDASLECDPEFTGFSGDQGHMWEVIHATPEAVACRGPLEACGDLVFLAMGHPLAGTRAWSVVAAFSGGMFLPYEMAEEVALPALVEARTELHPMFDDFRYAYAVATRDCREEGEGEIIREGPALKIELPDVCDVGSGSTGGGFVAIYQADGTSPLSFADSRDDGVVHRLVAIPVRFRG